MQASIVFCLLVFSICLQLKLHACDKICGKNQYTILRSDGSFFRCLDCHKCHRGYGLSPVCGTSIVHPPTDIRCDPCPVGKFSDEYDSAPCHPCQECGKHEIIASNCTIFSDRNCSGTCIKDYYFTKKAPHNCQMCSHCCFDGKDEIQLECVNQGLNATKQHCSRRLDKKCGPDPTPAHGTITPSSYYQHPTNSSSRQHDKPTKHGNGTGSIITIVLGVLSGLLVAVVVCAVLYKRRKVQTTRERHPQFKIEVNNLHETGEHQIPENQGNQEPHVQVVAQASRVQTLQINAGYAPSPQASPGETPNQTDDELEELPSKDVVVRTKRLLKRLNSKDAPNDSANEGLSAADIERQQDIKGAEGGHARKRSRSGSLQNVIRKLSLKDGYLPVPGEDLDDSQTLESIRIEEHPGSQEHKEGTRVELKCKANENRKVVYQWLKDEIKLQGQNSSVLVLESVKLRDFGCYSCEVRCADGYCRLERVVSSPAELDVTPCDGMRCKYLSEAFQHSLKTQQNVEKQLMKIGAGWKEVAHRYKMDKVNIDYLKGKEEAGERVLAHLDSQYPYLTVYEFCKTLKEPDIRRLDIVKELVGYLVLVPL